MEYEYKSAVIKESLEESRVRARQLVSKFNLTLIDNNEKGIMFKIDKEYWVIDKPEVLSMNSEINEDPNCSNYDLDTIKCHISINNSFEFINQEGEAYESICYVGFNYFDVISILIFNSFAEFENNRDQITSYCNKGKFNYLGLDYTLEWFSFLISRYNEWSDEAEFKLYSSMNNYYCDINEIKIPMWL